MDFNIKMGDLLYRTKGFVEHCGVYLGSNRVLHNIPNKGTEVISYEEFANNKSVRIVKTNIDSIQQLASRLDEILNFGNNYNVAFNNCEHIATLLVYGKKYSSQIQATIIGALLGLLVGKTHSANQQLIIIFLGGLLGCVLSNIGRKYDGEIPAI